MKGTILDFLELASEKPELAKKMIDLAAQYDFEFADDVSDEQLDDVVGGAVDAIAANSLAEPTQQGVQGSTNMLTQQMQMMSNIMKNQHDTLKAIINNMR